MKEQISIARIVALFRASQTEAFRNFIFWKSFDENKWKNYMDPSSPLSKRLTFKSIKKDTCCFSGILNGETLEVLLSQENKLQNCRIFELLAEMKSRTML